MLKKCATLSYVFSLNWNFLHKTDADVRNGGKKCLHNHTTYIQYRSGGLVEMFSAMNQNPWDGYESVSVLQQTSFYLVSPNEAFTTPLKVAR